MQEHQRTTKIVWIVLLNGVITLAEFVGGIFSGSLSLISDAFHNLGDTLAITLSYIAQKIASKQRDPKKTYGYQRSEILSAFVNSMVLVVLSLILALEAIKRFFDSEKIDSKLMLIVAVIGLVANLLSVLLLKKDTDKNLNLKSSYLHLLSDTLSSISVIVGALLIKQFGIYWIDPMITLLVSIYIFIEAVGVIKKTIDILMQSAPVLDYQRLKKEIESLSGVKTIHHIHIWQYSDTSVVFDAHIDFADCLLSEIEKAYPLITDILKKNYGITHVTIQAETNAKDQKKLILRNQDEISS